VERDRARALAEFAEQAARRLDGLDRKALFVQLEEQHRELVAAIAWFLNARQPDGAMRIANALERYWTATGRLEEGSRWFGQILEASNGSEPHLGRACFEAGLVEFWRGDDDRASALHHRALEVGRRSGDATISALALTGLARIALRSNQLDDAQQLCREALTASEGEGTPLGRASALHVLGVVAQMAGNLSEAREFMSERMALARELGQHGGIAAEAANLAMVEQQLGNLDRAEALSRESLEISRRREDEWMFPYGLSRLAAIAAERGELERAATLIGAAEAMMAAQAVAWPPDERPHYEQTVSRLASAMGDADFEIARARGRALATHDALELALAATLPNVP
jgi:tetratricopeptide (TPR) repeat protein